MVGLRWRYAVGAFLLLLTNGCALLIPWLLKLTVEGLRQPGSASFSTGQYAAAMAGLALLHCLVRIWSRTTILHAARIVEFRVREALFQRLLALDLSFYNRERTGDLLSRFSNDLGNVRMLVGFGSMSLLNTAIIYLAAVWLMLLISPWLTLAAVGPLPLMVLLVRRISGRVFNLSREAQEELARLSSLAEESVSAVRLLKSYCREPYFDRLFEQTSRDCLNKNLELARVRGLVMPIMVAATGIGTLAVLFIGGRQVITGTMSLGDFVAFSGYLALLAWPTAVMGWILTLLQRGAASMGRLNELLTATPLLETDAEQTATFQQSLELRQLSFSYGDRPVLQQISCSIRPGERLGVTGTVGSGKTTLLRVLARLLPVAPGQFLLDGHDVNQLSLASVRGLTGYLPQEAFLFSRSIQENIVYGGDGDALRGAEQAGLTSDLNGFAQGLATLVGERGVTLSGGQRQRVALARALVRQPALLLLDDPLASVDAGKEDEILDALAANWHDKTVVLVSQRLSAFRDCQRVLVLDEGRIVEQGSPAELLQRGGRYAQLARLQGKMS
ncbi:MAG: ABC transporter ATP-binding protein [Geobacter sp.]